MEPLRRLFKWCCCSSTRPEATINTVKYFTLPPAEDGLSWVKITVRRENLSDFRRLQRRSKTGSKGDVSRFFRCMNMDEVGADRFADEWDCLVQAMLPLRFSLPELVGTGGQGVVLLAKDAETEKKIALKHLYFGNRKLVSLIRLCREIRIGKLCDHPNICKMNEVLSFESPEELSYVIFLFEKVHTTLSDVLRECSSNPRQVYQLLFNLASRPSHQTASEWIYQLLSAVQYLHENDIIHRDLKPSNIGLTLTKELPTSQFNENFCNTVKLLDMGMARGMNGDRPLTPELGTYSYMAPELLLEDHKIYQQTQMAKNKKTTRPIGMYEVTVGFNNYDKSIDIWAIGVMFAEILLADGTKFFSSEGIIAPSEMLTAIAKIVTICDTKEYSEYVGEHNTKFLKAKSTDLKRKSLDQRLSDNLLPHDSDHFENLNGHNAKDLVKKMLRWNPKERITAKEALQHRYFLHLSPVDNPLRPKEKYYDNLPISYDDHKLVNDVDPSIVGRWKGLISAELNWKREEVQEIN